MKKSGGPVNKFPFAEEIVKGYVEDQRSRPLPNFSNTEKTFAHLPDWHLVQSGRMFNIMGKPWLTNIMGFIGVPAVQLGLLAAAWAVKNTVYRQFVGGTSLIEALPAIETPHDQNVTLSPIQH